MVTTRRRGNYGSTPPPAAKSSKRTSSGARKVKNKVSSPSPGKTASISNPLFSDLSSDEFDYGDYLEEDSKGDLDESDSSTVSGSSTKRQRLPLYLLKQLLVDIQQAGGIHCFHLKSNQALSEILNKRPDLYGSRGQPIRDRIRKKVHHWRTKFNHSESSWLEVLAQHQVVAKPSSKTAPVQPVQTEALDDAQDEQKPAARKSKEASEPTTKETITQSQPRVPQKLAVPLADSDLDMSSSPSKNPRPLDTDVIPVNINRPEDNREVSIYKAEGLTGVKDVNAHFQGYWIVMKYDPRFYADDANVEWYKARVYSSNQVLITLPSFDYSQMHCRDQIVSSKCPQSCTDAIDNGRLGYAKEEKIRQWKYLLLDFPDSHVLSSSEVYSEAGEDEELDFELFPVSSVHPKIPKVSFTDYYIAFRVARTDVAAYKKGKLETQKSKTSKGAAKLAALGLGNLNLNVAPSQPVSPMTATILQRQRQFKVDSLLGFGYKQEDVIRALDAANGNYEAAAHLLSQASTGQASPPQPSAATSSRFDQQPQTFGAASSGFMGTQQGAFNIGQNPHPSGGTIADRPQSSLQAAAMSGSGDGGEKDPNSPSAMSDSSDFIDQKIEEGKQFHNSAQQELGTLFQKDNDEHMGDENAHKKRSAQESNEKGLFGGLGNWKKSS